MDLAVLRELAEKATPGPWVTGANIVYDERAEYVGEAHEDADAAFIAAVSPEVVLALCDVAEAASEHQRLRTQLAYGPFPSVSALDGAAHEVRKALARLEELPVK